MMLLDRVRQELGSEFAVEREIGRGGMGAVFLAHDRSLDAPVAIKVLLPEQASGRTLERFRREARFLARFDHPHIVRALRAGTTTGGIDFLVMPYLPGDSLQARLDAEGPLPLPTAIRYGAELLDALGAIHAEHLVHRDVKPANILIVHDAIRLTDFGIVHDDGAGGDTLTQPDRQPGTARYMAPEQEDGAVDYRSDLYAAALVCHEMLTGKRWKEDEGWGDVPHAVAAVVQRGLHPDPARRWEDAASFRRAMLRASSPWRRRLAVGLAAVMVGLFAFVLWPPAPPSTLAVLPFRAGGGAALGEQLAGLVHMELAPHTRRGGAPLADWSRGLTWWNGEGRGDTLGTDALAALGASAVLTGTVESLGDSVVVRPAMTRRDGRRVGLGRFAAVRPQWSVLACRIAFAAAAWLDEAVAGEWRCALEGRDVDAVEALAAGQWAFDREMWALADQEFSRAIAADSTLALAWWRLHNTRRWRRVPSPVDLRRVQAQWGSQLGELDSLLLVAELAPAGPGRAALLEAAALRYPRHGQAWLLLGNELFHRGPLWGVGLDSALRVLHVATTVNPALAPALSTAAWAAVRSGDSAEAQDLLARYHLVASSATDEGFCLGCLLDVAWSARFAPEATGELRAQFATPDGVRLLARGLRWGLGIGIPHAQLAVAEALGASPALTPAQRADAAMARGLALIALGRPQAALRAFREGAAAAPEPMGAELGLVAAEWTLALAGLGVPGVDSGEVADARQRLAAWNGDRVERRRAEWMLHAFSREPSAPDVSRELSTWVSPFGRAVEYPRWAATQAPLNAVRWWRWHENSDLQGWPEGRLQAAEADWALETFARARAGLAVRAADRAIACALLRDVPDRWASAEPAFIPLRDSVTDALGGCRD